MLRSATRYSALDETALFGSACRHEFPCIFFNLKHGERYMLIKLYCICILFEFRLSYAVYLIEELLRRCNGKTVYITYDIACRLQKHLKVQ